MIDPAYNAWADERLIVHLRALDRPQGVDGVLAHLAMAGETWLARLDGTQSPSELWPSLAFEESAVRLAAVNARLREPREERPIHYRSFAGDPFENSVAEILTHVLNHATYHRGEIAGLLLAAGLEPPLTDYIVYLRER